MANSEPFDVIPTLREAMRKRSIKLTELAKLLEVPYRSLQNYFSGKTEMPLSLYLRLCLQLGLDPLYVRYGRFEIDTRALQKALNDVVGHGLPTHAFNEDGSMSLMPYDGAQRDRMALWRDAGTVADFVAGQYDLTLEREMLEPRIDDE